MNQTSYLNLKKPGSDDAVDVSIINENSDKIDHDANMNNIRLDLLYKTFLSTPLEADDEENPTHDTPTACEGILFEVACMENVDIGLRFFAGTSGEIYMSAKRNENAWHDWSEVVKPPDAEA